MATSGQKADSAISESSMTDSEKAPITKNLPFPTFNLKILVNSSRQNILNSPKNKMGTSFGGLK